MEHAIVILPLKRKGSADDAMAMTSALWNVIALYAFQLRGVSTIVPDVFAFLSNSELPSRLQMSTMRELARTADASVRACSPSLVAQLPAFKTIEDIAANALTHVVELLATERTARQQAVLPTARTGNERDLRLKSRSRCSQCRPLVSLLYLDSVPSAAAALSAALVKAHASGVAVEIACARWGDAIGSSAGSLLPPIAVAAAMDAPAVAAAAALERQLLRMLVTTLRSGVRDQATNDAHALAADGLATTVPLPPLRCRVVSLIGPNGLAIARRWAAAHVQRQAVRLSLSTLVSQPPRKPAALQPPPVVAGQLLQLTVGATPSIVTEKLPRLRSLSPRTDEAPFLPLLLQPASRAAFTDREIPLSLCGTGLVPMAGVQMQYLAGPSWWVSDGADCGGGNDDTFVGWGTWPAEHAPTSDWRALSGYLRRSEYALLVRGGEVGGRGSTPTSWFLLVPGENEVAAPSGRAGAEIFTESVHSPLLLYRLHTLETLPLTPFGYCGSMRAVKSHVQAAPHPAPACAAAEPLLPLDAQDMGGSYIATPPLDLQDGDDSDTLNILQSMLGYDNRGSGSPTLLPNAGRSIDASSAEPNFTVAASQLPLHEQFSPLQLSDGSRDAVLYDETAWDNDVSSMLLAKTTFHADENFGKTKAATTSNVTAVDPKAGVHSQNALPLHQFVPSVSTAARVAAAGEATRDGVALARHAVPTLAAQRLKVPEMIIVEHSDDDAGETAPPPPRQRQLPIYVAAAKPQPRGQEAARTTNKNNEQRQAAASAPLSVSVPVSRTSAKARGEPQQSSVANKAAVPAPKAPYKRIVKPAVVDSSPSSIDDTPTERPAVTSTTITRELPVAKRGREQQESEQQSKRRATPPEPPPRQPSTRHEFTPHGNVQTVTNVAASIVAPQRPAAATTALQQQELPITLSDNAAPPAAANPQLDQPRQRAAVRAVSVPVSNPNPGTIDRVNSKAAAPRKATIAGREVPLSDPVSPVQRGTAPAFADVAKLRHSSNLRVGGIDEFAFDDSEHRSNDRDGLVDEFAFDDGLADIDDAALAAFLPQLGTAYPTAQVAKVSLPPPPVAPPTVKVPAAHTIVVKSGVPRLESPLLGKGRLRRAGSQEPQLSEPLFEFDG